MHQVSKTRALSACLLLLTLAAASANCFPSYQNQPQIISRRSSSSEPAEAALVLGRFKAPAPERMVRTRIPKNSNFGSQTMSASYRISDLNQDSLPEKLVQGLTNQPSKSQRTVSAKMQVSDEGLNYPPSKLSADIHGNVAEIVTAPPEMVEQDFLEPQVSRLFGSRRAN